MYQAKNVILAFYLKLALRQLLEEHSMDKLFGCLMMTYFSLVANFFFHYKNVKW